MIEPAVSTLEPYYKLDVMTQIGSADLVITDPPYSFGLASTDKEGKAGSWADLMNNAHWYSAWMSEVKRITHSAQGAAWIFNSWRSFPILARGLRPSYELVALLGHSNFSIGDRGIPDIWRCTWASQRPSGHPAEKPVKLIQRMIRESGVPDDGLVLDPFAGSGSTLVAAKSLNLRCVGIEAEERYCDMAVDRLRQDSLFGDRTDQT